MGRQKRDWNVPFFVAQRAYERKLILAAIEAAGKVSLAGPLLGITGVALHKRINALGGILPGQPVNEPYKTPTPPRPRVFKTKKPTGL
jgi:hypothetical protein